MSYQDEPLETEEELRESYPALYGVKEDPYEPPPYKLTVEQQKFLDDQRAKYRARFAGVVGEHGEDRFEVVREHGEDYHNVDEITDEMLPTVNFRTFDNLFLARPAKRVLFSAQNRDPNVGSSTGVS